MKRWALFASAILTVSCGGVSQVTGAEGGASQNGGSSGSGGTTGEGGASPSLVGTWKGYVENHQFASGSDTIMLVITDETAHGHVVFGQGAAPPPATDPDAGYPPVADNSITEALPFEGFEYTLHAGNVTGDRVRFKVSGFELWKDWCALQTPIQTSAGYNCVPNGFFQSLPSGCSWSDPNTGQWVPLDCLKLDLCQFGVCACEASNCHANEQDEIAFDVDHSGNQLDGSVMLSDGVRNVRLDKQ